MNLAERSSAEVLKIAENAVRQSIETAFETMLGITVQCGTSCSKPPSSSVGRAVAGVIGWVGCWNGTGILECSPEVACTLANAMLGTDLMTISEDALDAVAEMANIVFGGMKTELEGVLGSMGLSTPTVIYGNEVGMRSAGEAFVTIPVLWEDQALEVKLYMAKVEDKRQVLNHFWAASCAQAM